MQASVIDNKCISVVFGAIYKLLKWRKRSNTNDFKVFFVIYLTFALKLSNTNNLASSSLVYKYTGYVTLHQINQSPNDFFQLLSIVMPWLLFYFTKTIMKKVKISTPSRLQWWRFESYLLGVLIFFIEFSIKKNGF